MKFLVCETVHGQVAPCFWASGVSAFMPNTRLGRSGRDGTTQGQGTQGVFRQYRFALSVFFRSGCVCVCLRRSPSSRLIVWYLLG